MREHYALQLTPVKDELGNWVTVFVHHIVSMHPQKDGTCVLECTKGEFHVRESEQTIIDKARGHNVIVKVGTT